MGKPRMTDEEYAKTLDRLGDNLLWPDDEPVDDMVWEAMFDAGIIPATHPSGTPEDKTQYALYYAKRKARGD